MSIFRKSEGDGKKKTMAGEMKRNLQANVAFGRGLFSLFAESGKSIKERREKTYAVADDVSIEEFKRRSVIFRRQVFLYGFMAILSFLLSPLFIHWHVLTLAGMYCATWYVIYIRDVHRVRLILNKWNLRSTPLSLTWTQFFNIIKKNPKYLNPLS